MSDDRIVFRKGHSMTRAEAAGVIENALPYLGSAPADDVARMVRAAQAINRAWLRNSREAREAMLAANKAHNRKRGAR